MNDTLVEWVNDKEKAQEGCSNRHIERARSKGMNKAEPSKAGRR